MFSLLHGALAGLSITWLFIILGSLITFFSYRGFSSRVWFAALLVTMFLLGFSNTTMLVFAVLGMAFVFSPTRRILFSAQIVKFIKAKKILPPISETEKVALEAGSTWVDADLFSGSPDIKKLMQEPLKELTQEELDFIKGPCEEVCRITNDEENYKNKDLSSDVWDLLKKERFFGLNIPKEYGGRGFSAMAHSDIVHKLSTRSVPLAITTMVPNSLGPAELIMHYGTEKQKKRYLPGLANGDFLPCFALTEAQAGSDAGSMISSGVVFRGENREILLKLNWNKRYITLGGISTLIGLAVKVSDPENILSKGKNIGITCVLVEKDTKGVKLGRRHDPLGVPFYNSPIEGKDVIVSLEQVIGGESGLGEGWKMLMECLSAGRSISLPSYSAGVAKFALLTTSAYAMTRRQFGVSIANFEGISEVIADVIKSTYVLEASRCFTISAVDRGIKPSVISAIVKYNSTEIHRDIVIKSMDLLGGAGISMGPKNFMARNYIAAPIAITVEGANILTRSMIVFGQGAIRCHPYAYKEMMAIEKDDIKSFDQAFCGHIKRVLKLFARTVVLYFTRARFIKVPQSKLSTQYKKLIWASNSFAWLSELTMGCYGGRLKFKERITGRFADAFSWLYLITAVMRRYESSKSSQELVVVEAVCKQGFVKIQESLEKIYQNFDAPFLGKLLRGVFLPLSRMNMFSPSSSDRADQLLVKLLLEDKQFRDELTKQSIFLPKDMSERVVELEEVFDQAEDANLVLEKINRVIRKKKLPKRSPLDLIKEAKNIGVIDEKEALFLIRYKELHDSVTSVDSYSLDGEADLLSRKKDESKKLHSEDKTSPLTTNL